MKLTACLLTGLACVFGHAALAGGNDTNAARVGVYDSRAVAYAYFSSAPYQKHLQEAMASARAARAAGDTNKFEQCSAGLRAAQDTVHRETFSTAPVDEAMASIQARIPQITQELGVTALASKWDDKALKPYPEARQVDVTDRLVREFIQPTEKQAATLSALQKSKPLTLEKANELIRQGKL